MAYIEESLVTAKADFFSDKIIIKKKKGDIVIERKEIEKLCYARPTFWNFIFAGVNQILPGQLVVWLKRPIKKGKKAGYVLRMKYDNFLRIPYDIRSLTELY